VNKAKPSGGRLFTDSWERRKGTPSAPCPNPVHGSRACAGG
jgi:hypothetical protein